MENFSLLRLKKYFKILIYVIIKLKSKNYLKLLGAKKISYIGNLKFTQSEKATDELNNNIKKFFNKKNMVCIKYT